MRACWECNLLVGKSKDMPPHEQLRFTQWIDQVSYRQIRAYACDACGAKWNRYDDAKDRFAGWARVA